MCPPPHGLPVISSENVLPESVATPHVASDSGSQTLGEPCDSGRLGDQFVPSADGAANFRFSRGCGGSVNSLCRPAYGAANFRFSRDCGDSGLLPRRPGESSGLVTHLGAAAAG